MEGSFCFLLNRYLCQVESLTLVKWAIKLHSLVRNLEITTDNWEIEPSRLLISPQIY